MIENWMLVGRRFTAWKKPTEKIEKKPRKVEETSEAKTKQDRRGFYA